MTATVENLDVSFQRVEIARVDLAGGVVDRMAVASLARRPFEPYVPPRLQTSMRLKSIVIRKLRDRRRILVIALFRSDRIDDIHVLDLPRKVPTLPPSAPPTLR